MSDFNYNKLKPFKWFVLENFPFIEANFDALTEWQLFCKLGKEINKIISNTNILGTQVENLTTYVSNYFNNLDVQDEINNKLDEMASSGELATIIDNYLKLNGVLSFNTINDMINSEIVVENSTCVVLGNTQINDGYIRLYKIEKIVSANPDEVDGINLITLNRDDLYARLIKDNTIDKVNILEKLFLSIDNFPKQNGETTDTERIQRAINYLNTESGGSLYIPNGNYTLNDTIILYPNIRIIGESVGNVRIDGNFNKPLFEINNKNQRNDNIEISNISLHKDYLDNDTPIIDLQGIGYSIIKNVSFYNHSQLYNSIGILLGEWSYYNVIQDCQFRGFKKCVYFTSAANGNIVRGGSCISSENGIEISGSNTNRIIAHNCEILSGIAYYLHNHSLHNVIIAPRIEDCFVGFQTEFLPNSMSSFDNFLIAPEFYLKENQTQYINPVYNNIIDSVNWSKAFLRSGLADFKATKKYGQPALVANTPTKVLFNQTQWDSANSYNTTTDIFTANEAGRYNFNAQLDVNNITAGTVFLIMIYVNGQPVITKTELGIEGSRQSLTITSNLNLSANDTVELYLQSTSTNAILQGLNSYFEGYKI